MMKFAFRRMLAFALPAFLGLAACDQQQQSEDGAAEAGEEARSVLDQTSEVNADSGAKIDFPRRSHDFGQIVEGDKAKHTFNFRNIGTDTLVIKNARASCGCTTANNSKRVAPGEEGYINVEFNSEGRVGKNSKTVTVSSNSEIEPEVVLQFQAEVLTAEEAVNAGVKPLSERAAGE